MNIDRNKVRLSKAQVIQRFSAQWGAARKKEATLRGMKDFCQQFHSYLTENFTTNVSIETLQGLFLVSESQACLDGDIVENVVQFRARRDVLSSSKGDSNFDMICCKFLERLCRRQLWYCYQNLVGMFESTIVKNPSIDCKGITVKHVLQQLLKKNAVEIRYSMGKSKAKTVTALGNKFISYINRLGPDRPVDRNALEVAYGRFIQSVPPDVMKLPFKPIVDYLKEKKVVKFSSGTAVITYSKQKRFATDQHFVRRHQKADGQDGVNTGGNDTINSSQKHTISKQLTRYLIFILGNNEVLSTI